MNYLDLITPIATYPVSLTEVKAHLYIDGSDSDTRLTALIQAATIRCEEFCERAFAPQTRELVMSGFPCWTIDLPYPPVTSITSVKYRDSDDAEQTLSTNDYRSLLPTEARAFLEPVEHWPDTYCRSDAVKVRFVTGACPTPVKHAILLQVGSWNLHREDETTVQTKQLAHGVKYLLEPYRVWGYQWN